MKKRESQVRPTIGPSVADVLDGLAQLSVTHVVGIPDNATGPLFDHLQGGVGPSLLTVTREGEAFAAAAGLWIGGARPFVTVQSTGLLESGDAVRGTVVRMGVPLLCMVGYRGFAKMERAGVDPNERDPDPATLRRADVDSAALVLEPTLRAWGLPYEIVEGPGAATQIVEAGRRAAEQEHPRMLLLTTALR